MKISKLFHWLYAFLMALPIFAVLSACLISTFNMSAKEESIIQYKYGTNEVNDNTDLVRGSIYHLDYTMPNGTNNIVQCFGIYNLRIKRGDRVLNLNYDIEGNDVFTIASVSENSTLRIYDSSNYVINNITYVDSWSFDVVFSGLIDITNTTFSICENLPILDVEDTTVEVQNIFYDSLNIVANSPVFVWAYNSNILGVPISYIGGIFGLASNSIVNVLLCYWVAISIIWLVFDLVMYVPLLVHRWLDKGVLE